MSQLKSNAMSAADPGVSPGADQLVDSYGEALMDELFEDVDRILEGDETVVIETEAPTAPAAPAFSADSIDESGMIVPFDAKTAVASTADSEPTELAAAASGPSEEEPDSEPARRRRWQPAAAAAGGLLLGATAFSLWWLGRPAATPQPVATADTAITEEAAFGEYLKRSLRVIRGENIAQGSSGSGPVATVPAPPENPPAPSDRKPNVIERVFVPVFQPGNRGEANRPALSALPAPNLPTPSNSSADGTTAAAPQQVPNIAPVNTYELVGVLELGERSAALFEINGTSQRIYVGEAIGASGWSIVSISNQEVVVRRNGEVRSIYIGQQF